MNKTVSRAIASAWLLAMLVAQVHATTNLYTWDGSAGDGDWFNAANWTGPTGDGIPGQTHNVATTNVDQAAIGNISGAITYTPGTPVVFDYLNITKSDAALLTININGGMTTTHAAVSTPNWNATTEVLGSGGNLAFNVNTGLYACYAVNLTINLSTLTVQSNASMIAFYGASGANRSLTLSKGTVTVYGALATINLTTESTTKNNPLNVSGGTKVIVDGGILKPDALTFATGGAAPGTVILTNNANAMLRYGGSGFLAGGNNGSAGYFGVFHMSSGSFTNPSSMLLAGDNTAAGTNDAGQATVTLTGGTWYQGGVSVIGDLRQAVMTVSGGLFTTPSDLYVGGGRRTAVAAPTPSLCAGTLTITGGTVRVSNPEAMNVNTATVAGAATGANLYFGRSTWDHTYRGQRVAFSELVGGIGQLSTGTIYRAADVNTGSDWQKTAFSVETDFTLETTGVTGTTYSVNSKYYTLPARLLIGERTTCTNGTFLVPGTLNLLAGSLIADELIATNGAYSVINFSGGTLSAQAIKISNGVPLTVGNGASAAALNLLASNVYTFADGLVVNTNATLSAGGTGVVQRVNIAGAVTFRSNAVYDWDCDATSADQLLVAGTLTLPSQATVQARRVGGGAVRAGVLMSAPTIVGTPNLWTISGATGFHVSVNGTNVVMSSGTSGSVLIVR